MKGEKYKVRTIPANKLTVDHTYQRDPRRAHYRKIAAALDFDALGVFVVSEREDGTLVIIDGQHRWMALHEQGVAEWEVVCRVYGGLSRKREAAMYRMLNHTLKTTAWDDFKAGLEEGDEESLAIQRIASAAGWEVSNQAADGRVCCVSTLRQVFRRDGGPLALKRSLEDIRSAWGDAHAGVDRSILAGLAHIHGEFDGQLDRARLIKKLSKAKGGPNGILGMARQLADIRSQPLYRICAGVVVEHYNRGARVDRLPDL